MERKVQERDKKSDTLNLADVHFNVPHVMLRWALALKANSQRLTGKTYLVTALLEGHPTRDKCTQQLSNKAITQWQIPVRCCFPIFSLL